MKYDAVRFLSGLFAAKSPILVDSLSAYWREILAERAAIKEYCGGLTRELAEAQALAETVQRMQADQEREKNEKGLALGIL